MMGSWPSEPLTTAVEAPPDVEACGWAVSPTRRGACARADCASTITLASGCGAHVPEGCVNVHGHRHLWMPSGTRHINVAVEQVDYQPKSLTIVRRLAARLAEGQRVPGRTTAEQLMHVDPADPEEGQ